MIPIKVTLSGFMSYKEAQPLDFSSDSLWVLVGKNAAGKSTVFDAITFALFGQPRAKGINNADLVNKYSDEAVIVFDFAVGSNLYRVRRTIDKKGHVTRQASSLIINVDATEKEDGIPGTDKEKGFDNWIENEIGLNFDIFTTSILLRQGKADALLEAGTDVRYNVLSKLIDLSKYESLAEKAHDWKKFWSAQADAHKQNLDRIVSVTADSLEQAKLEIEQEAQAVIKAHKKVDQLTGFLRQAGQWELWNNELATNNRRRSEFQALLEKEKEINDRYQRWDSLRSALPGLISINSLLVRSVGRDTEILRLSRETDSSTAPLQEAEDQVVRLAAEVKKQEKQVGDIRSSSNKMAERVGELAPVIILLDQIEHGERELVKYQKELEGYPANLDDLLQHEQEVLDQLRETRQAQNSLVRLVNERLALRRAIDSCDEIDRGLAEYDKQLTQRRKEKGVAQLQVEDLQKRERDSQDTLFQSQIRETEARERLQRFNEVAGAARCRYCDQEMTEDHKAIEMRILQEEVQKQNGEVNLAENMHLVAEQSLRDANTCLTIAMNALNGLETNYLRAQHDLETAKINLQTKLEALTLTYRSLPNVYQAKVISSEPSSPEGWLDSTFPSFEDLAVIDAEVKSLPNQQRVVNELAGRQAARNTTRALLAAKQQEIHQARSKLPLGWENASAEHSGLVEQKAEVDSTLTIAQKCLEQTRQDLEIARSESNDLRDKQTRRKATLEALEDARTKDQEQLKTQVECLSSSWRTEVKALTPERLVEYQLELSELAQYVEMHRELAVARQTLHDIDARIQKDQDNINRLPAEARQPATQIENTLTTARRASEDAEKRKHEAEQKHKSMEEQQRQYAETEQKWKEASRKAYLYGILMGHLGEKGIQKALINKSEEAIVRLANDMLDNLSGGRNKLRLREAGGKNKALDVEVWDRKTGGDKPLLVGLASGSQRFRIAISLALAIGQYIGHESHRVESVIIDEGFGSLDREGRDSVKQELHNLRQHLKRIILVSHQEEFSEGFSSGYDIQIVNNASHVKPMDH